MAYVGKHNLHMIHKLTKPVFSIVSSATFKSSGCLRFALLWLIFFITCFSPNRSAFFQFMHIGQFFKFSFNEETLLSPTIYYQRLSSVQRLCYQESKSVFVSSANGEIWIFFFDLTYFINMRRDADLRPSHSTRKIFQRSPLLYNAQVWVNVGVYSSKLWMILWNNRFDNFCR